MQKNKFTYEVIMNSGAKFFIKDVYDLRIEYEGKKITKLDINGSEDINKLIFINIDDISGIIKRKQKRSWIR